MGRVSNTHPLVMHKPFLLNSSYASKLEWVELHWHHLYIIWFYEVLGSNEEMNPQTQCDSNG